jgi:hypothetical protein
LLWNAVDKIYIHYLPVFIYSVFVFRLAKSISSQIKDRLNKSHEAFLSALKQLEMKHCGRLDKIEEERLKLRKVHAPRVAKVALESTSLKDLILHGMRVFLSWNCNKNLDMIYISRAISLCFGETVSVLIRGGFFTFVFPCLGLFQTIFVTQTYKSDNTYVVIIHVYTY